jgi:hypothetical protein
MLLWLLCAGVWAAEPLVVTGAVTNVSLSPHLSFFRDSTGRLTLEDVMAPARAAEFMPVTGDYPSFGYTRDAFWIRFSVRSAAEIPLELLTELCCSRFDWLDWYVLSDGRLIYHEATGNRRPYAPVRMLARRPVLPLVVQPGDEMTIYLRGQTETSVLFPLTLHSAGAYADSVVKRDMLDYAHLGFCVAVIIISLILGFSMKTRLYFINVGIVTAYVLYFIISNGFYAWLQGPFTQYVTRQGMLLVGVLCLMGLLLYAKEFSGIGAFHQRAYRILMGCLVAMGISAAVMTFMPYYIGVMLLNICVVMATCWGMGIAIWQYFYRKQDFARFYLLGWLITGGIIWLLILQWFGALPVLIRPPMGMKIGLISTSSMFLVAIADRAHQLYRQTLQAQESERRLVQARLEALRYQINPHFLFNTLNSVEALSREQPSRIPELVRRLAAFLRLTLDPWPESLSPFERELEAVQAYLDIEKTRFEERLEVEFDIQDETKRCRVPELILQPLVENAIKHGMHSSARPLRIRIRAALEKEKLVLEIANTGCWRDNKAGPISGGIGLENLKKRLEQLYGADQEFIMREVEDWVVVILRLPRNGKNEA